MNDTTVKKAAIVTGSSGGIGAATALKLAERGVNVMVNYRSNLSGARKVAADCRALGVSAIVVKADVASDTQCQHIVDQCVSRLGRIDYLVNNAGTTKFVQHDNLEGLSGQDFQDIYGVNVIGAYQMTRAAAPHLKATGAGSVVNVSSIAGVIGTGSCIAYAASKGALNTLTLSLARALGPEIRVNTVCPGFVQGDWLRDGMGAENYLATQTALEANNPLRRTATPEDVAEAVVMLLLGGGHVTGEILMTDGGQHLYGAPLKAR